MNTSHWLSVRMFCGIVVLALSVDVRADDEEAWVDSQPVSPPASEGGEKSAEKSVLIAQEANEPIDGKQDFCHCVGDGKSEIETRIYEALRGPLRSTGLEFTETPLKEVIHKIGTEYGFPTQLDETALEEVGLSNDEPVTAQLQNISLRSALRLMLKRLNLNYLVHNEVLLITTKDQAERYLQTCVYDVEALIDESNKESMDALIDTIVTCVATETWAENGGGEAEVRPLKPGLLVISQTQEIHEEVAGLLTAIRKMREDVPFTIADPNEPDPAEQQ